MTSADIYNYITPTYLYIKQHSVTGLKYFGKTTKPNPYKYIGSGTRWTRHLKRHGKEHVTTLWVSELFVDKSLLIEFALFVSEEYNIVESNDWANLIPENGLGGKSPIKLSRKEIRAIKVKKQLQLDKKEHERELSLCDNDNYKFLVNRYYYYKSRSETKQMDLLRMRKLIDKKLYNL